MGLVEGRSLLDLEQESYPAYEDFVALPFFVFFFPTVRFFLDRFVIEVRDSNFPLLGFICFGCSFFGVKEKNTLKLPQRDRRLESPIQSVLFLSCVVFLVKNPIFKLLVG